MPADTAAAFFSYCREDSDFALRLAEDLKAAGANVWIDQLDIEPGVPWDRSVEDALINCPRMLVILSPVSVKSDNVRDEVSFALSKQKRVIPVLYRDCDVPFRLARLQHIDFRTDYTRGVKLLLKALGVDHPVAAAGAAAPAPAGEALPAAPDSGVRRLVAEQVELELQRRLAAERARQEEERKQAAEQARLGEEQRQAAEKARQEEAERERQVAAEKARLEESERERLAALATEKARREQEERERQAAAEQALEAERKHAARLEEERKQAAEQDRLQGQLTKAEERESEEEHKAAGEPAFLEQDLRGWLARRGWLRRPQKAPDQESRAERAPYATGSVLASLARHWKLVLAVPAVFIAAGIVGFMFEVRGNSEISKAALAQAQLNPAFVQRLGEPVKYGWFPDGSYSTANASGHADLAIAVSGPKAKGTLYAAGTETSGKWMFATLQLKVQGDNERIDLLQASQAFPAKPESTRTAAQVPSQQNEESSRVTAPSPQTVTVRHILIKTPAPGPDGKVDQAGVDVARNKAEGILKQLKAGASFAALAKKYSDDPASAQNGGLLGPITNGQSVPEFEQAAFSTPPGQTTGLVRSTYGFEIIHVEAPTGSESAPAANTIAASRGVRSATPLGASINLLTAQEMWYLKLKSAPPTLTAEQMRKLGFAHENGYGLKKDLQRAFYWYREAAEAGNASAMARLGAIYLFARGVPKDSQQGIAWYRKAAEVGNADGMYGLGEAYDKGFGVEKDRQQAIFWYRKAAQAGNGSAAVALGEMGESQ